MYFFIHAYQSEVSVARVRDGFGNVDAAVVVGLRRAGGFARGRALSGFNFRTWLLPRFYIDVRASYKAYSRCGWDRIYIGIAAFYRADWKFLHTTRLAGGLTSGWLIWRLLRIFSWGCRWLHRIGAQLIETYILRKLCFTVNNTIIFTWTLGR